MTLHDDTVDQLVDTLHFNLDLPPGALDRIRTSLLASAPATAAEPEPIDQEWDDRATVWEEDRRPSSTLLILAAAVTTMFVVLLAATVRPGNSQEALAAAALAGDSDFQVASAAFAAVVPSAWTVAGPQQRAELADGVLTEAEYLAGFDRYRACLNAHGYDFGFVRMQGPLVNFGIPSPGAVEAGVDKICHDREWYLSDGIWQDQHPEASEANLMRKACLDQAGLPSGSTAEETAELFDRSGLSHDACLTSWLESDRSWAEYPE